MENISFIEVRNPFSGEVIERIEKLKPNEVDEVFSKSHNYFQNKFKFVPAYERAEILYKVSQKIKENSEELALLIAKEGGKPLKDARVEVARAVNTVKMSGDFALNLNGEQISLDRAKGTEKHIAFTLRQPLGTVFAISAFNHPINLICHQVATAIAAGNTVIIKPAEKTPLSAKKIAQFFYEAGLEKEALSYLVLTGEETQQLLNNPAIKYVSFIGNASIGWMIRKNVGNGVKVMLEHGGNATAVVDEICDLDNAVVSITKGGYYHSGQVCVSTQNVFVHQNIFHSFLQKFKKSVSNLITGDAEKPETDCGPLITKAVIAKMNYLISDAVKNGANVVIGGEELPNQCFQPTILTEVKPDMEVFSEEVFGPIVSVIPFESIEEVIKIVNASKFSFQTAIYTNNINLAFYYAKKIEQKACIINDSTAFRVDWMPFGGIKESGFGTGGIKYAIEDMTEEKLIVIKENY